MVVQLVQLVQRVVRMIVIITKQYFVGIVADKHPLIPTREVQIGICKVCQTNDVDC
jgi:hypothetical protein